MDIQSRLNESIEKHCFYIEFELKDIVENILCECTDVETMSTLISEIAPRNFWPGYIKKTDQYEELCADLNKFKKDSDDLFAERMAASIIDA